MLAGHQRHVVNYRRKQTDDGIDRVDVVHSLVETFSHSPQDAGAFQSGNGHQDTQEEKNGRHVYVLDDLGDPILDRFLDIVFTSVHQVGIEP